MVRSRVTLRVANVLPFTVLKIFAFQDRHENKDAYDLVFTLLNGGGGPRSCGRAAATSAIARHTQGALAEAGEEFPDCGSRPGRHRGTAPAEARGPRVAANLLEEAIAWLQERYDEFEFWVERDLVWTLQSRLRQMIKERSLPFSVVNDYPLLPGARRALSADLVIRDAGETVLVAAEFKYEPSHRRAELLPGKLPVVFWGDDGVAKDVRRIREFVEQGVARAAFAVFIDEGGYFRHRPAHPGTAWRDWPPSRPGGHQVSVLWARWPQA